MPNQNILKYALANALWTALYIILIGGFFNNAQAIFGDGQKMLIPVVMLLLFVFSATRDGFYDGRALHVEIIQ